MKWLLPLFLLLLRSCEIAPAGVLSCEPVGTATRYEFHLGQQSGRYTNTFASPGPSITLSNLAEGQWFAVITAHNAAEACPFWETSDPADDVAEITFTISGPQMVEIVTVRSTNATSARSGWTPVLTNRVPRLNAKEFYALRISDVTAPLLTSGAAAAQLPPAPLYWISSNYTAPTPPLPKVKGKR